MHICMYSLIDFYKTFTNDELKNAKELIDQWSFELTRCCNQCKKLHIAIVNKLLDTLNNKND